MSHKICSLLHKPENYFRKKFSLSAVYEKLSLPRWRWCPRPDVPGIDEQTSFLTDFSSRFIVLLGGNGSGKTEASAVKIARIVCDLIPPPRPVSVFAIVGPSLDQACGICWKEKLFGKQLILDSEIDWQRCSWINRNRNFPRLISLIPDSRGYRWELAFMSVEQTRRLFQGYAIDGFWISEQIPWEIVVELYRGTRETALSGTCIYEHTPIDPSLAVELKSFIEQNKTVRVYHLSTLHNFHISDDWKASFASLLPDEIKNTRLYGHFPQVVGSVFAIDPERIFGIKPFKSPKYRVIGIDWGGGGSHPTACVFAYVYDDLSFYVTNELIINDENQTVTENIKKIKQICTDINFRPSFVVADSENRLANNELSKHFTIRTANKVLFDSIDRIRFLLKTGKLTISKNCQNLFRQLQNYRFADKSKVDVIREDNDLVDALRYLVMSIPSTDIKTIASGHSRYDTAANDCSGDL